MAQDAGYLTIDDGLIYSGTYTPNLTNTANIAASTAYACQYLRVGNVVTVSGKVDIDVTSASTITTLGLSIPIASNFSSTEQCGGVCVTNAASASAYNHFAIYADATNDRTTFENVCGSGTANTAFFFTFTYRII